MPYDWFASSNRLMKALSGSKRIDRVPYLPIIDEQMLCRVTGMTAKEILNSPETYSKALIKTNEFFQSDTIPVPTAYAGPAEALAFAEANNRMDTIRWFDYKPLAIKQGEICKTEEDIDKLEIPDHSKIKLWKTTFSAAKLIYEKTKVPPNACFGIWSIVQELRGVQAYKDIRRDPALLLKLCEKVYESQMDVYNNWIEEIGRTPFIFYTGYAFNKHMMSYQDAMKYEGQFMQRIIKETKTPIILHNCGTKPYWEVCKDIDIACVNGSHPLDIDFWIQFREEYSKVAIWGANIDVSREMLTGTPEDIELKVRENIINLAPKSRYIVGPICCLPWGVPLQNVLAIPKAIEKYGKYPIQAK